MYVKYVTLSIMEGKTNVQTKGSGNRIGSGGANM